MKVVLFCGGQGLRLREYSENVPKPMVPIGYRPIVWHLMRYYAHYGYREFILCLGYQADVVKQYFLNYNECITNDFVLSQGGREIQLLSRDVDDWKITFVDTGFNSNVAQRLHAVRDYLGDDEHFMFNYSDNLTDFPIDRLVEFHHAQNRMACFLGVKPSQTFHLVRAANDGTVERFIPVAESDIRINGGFFVARRDFLDYIQPGDDLPDVLDRISSHRQLVACNYDGFWACMDTFKEKQTLDDLHTQGKAPWEVWEQHSGNRRHVA